MAKEKVSIVFNADTGKAEKSLDRVEKKTKDIEGGFKSLGGTVAKFSAIMAAAAAGGIAFAISKASDLEETTSKFNTVFKGVEGTAKEFEKSLVESYNLSTEASRRYLASMQDLLVPMGMAADSASKMSGEVVQLVANLGSFNDLPTEQVMADIQSAMVGNFETMKKYGVVLNATNVQQKALNMGLAESAKDLTAAQKAQAAYALILEGTQAAQGDVIRTSGSFANQMRRLQARFDDITASIGQIFIPVAKDMVKAVANVLTGIDNFLTESRKMTIIESISGFFAILAEVSKILFSVLVEIGKEVGGAFIQGWKEVFGETKKGTKDFTVLSVIIKGLSVGLRILGKVVSGVITTFFNFIKIIKDSIKAAGSFWDALTGKKKWGDVGRALKNVGGSIKDFVVDGVGAISNVVGEVTDEFATMGVVGSANFKGIEGSIKDINNALNTATKNAGKLIDDTKGGQVKVEVFPEIDQGALMNQWKDASSKLQVKAGDFKEITEKVKFAVDIDVKGVINTLKDGLLSVVQTITGAAQTDIEKRKKALEDQIVKENELTEEQINRNKQLEKEIKELDKASKGANKFSGILGTISSAVTSFAQGGAAGAITGVVTLISGLVSLIADELTPVFTVMIPIFKRIQEQFSTLAGILAPVIAAMMQDLGQALINVNDAIIVVAQILAEILPHFSGMSDILIMLTEIVLSLTEMFASLLSILTPILPVLDMVLTLVTMILTPLNLFTTTMSSLNEMLEMNNPELKQMAEFIKMVSEKIKDFRKSISDLTEGLGSKIKEQKPLTIGNQQNFKQPKSININQNNTVGQVNNVPSIQSLQDIFGRQLRNTARGV